MITRSMANWSRGGAIRLVSLWLPAALGCGLPSVAAATDAWLASLSGTVGNHRSPEDQVGFSDEHPAHEASLEPFYLQSRETTKAEWDTVRNWGLTNGYADLPEGSNGSGATLSEAGLHPVVGVSWFDAVKWCNARSEMDGVFPAYYLDELARIPCRTGETASIFAHWEGSGWRLPSEQEWELAARGGLENQDYPWHATSAFFAENISSNQARFNAPSTLPPGQFSPNPCGLHDMAGNAAEWCWDWYDPHFYGSSNSVAYSRGPDAPPLERAKSVRGGSWRSGLSDLRVAARGMANPSRHFNHVGFRTARSQLPIKLTSIVNRFTATEENGQVVLRWWTSDESGVDGFRICRYANGAWVPVHADFIPAHGGASSAYAFVDTSAVPGIAHLYRVELVSGNAIVLQGPFNRSASPLQMLGPAVSVPNGVEIRWDSRPDELYVVRRSSNLFAIPQSLSGPLQTNVFVDTNPPPTAFYGIEMIAPSSP